ncbi:hypothetical protein [Luteibacter sp. CQ10]|uniref:hypothetical protein n=1 Tax=Luteibacter sp. CQ10 TaxID=2805821 RepID=UPI0034A3DB2F
MKPVLSISLVLCLAAPVSAQTATTGTARFAGHIVQTTERMGATVSTLDAHVARRTWRSHLLDYAMTRTRPGAWRAVVVEYR